MDKMENLEIKIRIGERKDCSSILKLIKELPESDNINFTLKELESEGFDDVDTRPLFYAVVAENGAKLVGVVLYHIKYSTWEGPAAHLNTFVVSEGYRRKGVGSQLLKALGKVAKEKNYPRISFEVPKNAEPAINFFFKHGAVNLTEEEGWLNFLLDSNATKKLLELTPNIEGVEIRASQPKDCSSILEMILELAEFEKMPNGPQLAVKELQRDGFYKLFPDYVSFVAELTTDDGPEIIGFLILFYSFDPMAGKRVHLEDLYVKPKHRASGVGSLLFQTVAKFVEERCLAGFTLEVLNWNTKAIQFYEKFGGINLTDTKQLQSFRFKKDAIQNLASQ